VSEAATAGQLLTSGTPQGNLPNIRERQQNFMIVKGSKYAIEAEKLAERKSVSQDELRK
jgi:hypothetical protein